MRVTTKTHPKLWEMNGDLSAHTKLLGVYVDDAELDAARAEADKSFPHLSAEERETVAVHMALTHPGTHSHATPEASRETLRQVDKVHTNLLIAIIVLLVALIVLVGVAHAEPERNIVSLSANLASLRARPAQTVVNPSQFKFNGSGALIVSCPDGTCSGGGGGGGGTSSLFGAAFPASGTAVGFIDASGNMAGANLDASGNLKTFLENSTIAVTQSGSWAISFTAPQHVIIDSGTTAVTNAGTFAVQATLSAETTKVIGTVNQGTSPWVTTGSGSAGSAATGVLTVQGIASMVHLLVTPDANSSVNLSQVNGVTTQTGAGAVGTGSQRVAVGQDTSTIAGSAPGTAGTPSTQVVSMQGVAGGTAIPVSLASAPTTSVTQGTSPWVVSCTAANCPINEAQVGGTAVVADPCQSVAKVYTPVSQAAAGPTTVILGTSAKKTYLCSILLVTATAQNVNLVEGTGTNCSSVTSGLLGGTTAATGPNLAANGGFAHGEGNASIAATATTADTICIIVSGTGQVSGVLTSVQE